MRVVILSMTPRNEHLPLDYEYNQVYEPSLLKITFFLLLLYKAKQRDKDQK